MTMNVSLLTLVGVLVGGMLLRMPIGFSMIASGIAYLLVSRQDMGLVTEQIGNGTATHAREDHTDQNVHLGQATAHATHQHPAEVKNAVTDRACIHDVGGKHKKRHRQQHVAVVEAVADLLHRQTQILALHQQVTNPCGQHRKPDGHPHQHARHQNAGKNKKCKSHRRSSVSRPLPRMASHTFQALRSTSEMSKRTKGRKIQLNGTSSTGEPSRPMNFT